VKLLTASTSGASGRGDTRARILDAAERLVQQRGFNGFSYATVAAELGVTKAALHHHFPSKTALGEALITRYSERFAAALEAIDATDPQARAKLAAYVELYARVLREGRMCLCGMLAAEYETLAPPIRQAVLEFLEHNESWLAGVLEQGRADGSMRFSGSAAETADSILGGLEGTMLVARSYGDPVRFEATAARLLAGLTGEQGARS